MADGLRRPPHPPWAGEPHRTRVKICCIASEHEAAVALETGADLVGLVSAMPSGPGPIEESRIADIVRWTDGRAGTVLLTSRQDAASIATQLDAMRPAVVQLVDELPLPEYGALRASHPAVVLMQVIHVRGMESVDEAVRVAPHVDVILLDSGNPALPVKELGGTGRVHDWSVSRALREAVPVPVLLAGGLRADNVAAAIEMVRPFGVDVCSGVRTAGQLDPAKAAAFVAAVRAAG
ncbi:MAG: N-(5-phosphoribosyl)anthranilate isomerase [Gemmatimonadetes bacterium]|nr:N-(5-phosphoribosyl)anthranilate isomerase [Gemmatimonadota bacterium]